MNRDPIAEKGGLNLYGFVGNEPVSKWDILGKECGITVHRAPVTVDFDLNMDFDFGPFEPGIPTFDPELDFTVGHEWIEIGAKDGFGFWPAGGNNLYTEGVVESPDTVYHGERGGTDWEVTCSRPVSGIDRHRSGILKYGKGKGKSCKCATCDEKIDCIRKVAEIWDTQKKFCLIGQNCRSFVSDALSSCGLRKGKEF